MDHRQTNHGFARTGRTLPVQSETSIATQPSEGSLCAPALGQQDESLRSLGPRDDLQLIGRIVGHPDGQVMVAILLIRPHQSQSRKIVIVPLGSGSPSITCADDQALFPETLISAPNLFVFHSILALPLNGVHP